jgi:hypothetical protein
VRHTALLVSLLACLSSYAAGGFTATGGIAKAVGEGSDDVNIGLNLGASLFGLVAPTVGLGGEFRFNSWSFDVPAELEGLDLSLQYYEFLFTPVFLFPLETNVQFVLQPGIGLFNGVAKASYNGKSDSDSEADLGISLQGHLAIQRFVIQPAFKIVFTEGESTKWFVFNIGYQTMF